MSFVPAAIAAASALGGAFANRSATTTQNSTPIFDASQLALRNNVIANYMKLLQGTDLSGYAANQEDQINHDAFLQGKANDEFLASHGITGPAAALARMNLNNSRFSNIVNLQNSIPLLQMNLRSQIAQNAGGFFNSMPHRTITTGVAPGNVAGGGIGGGAAALAYLYGNGSFNNNTNNNAPTAVANPVTNFNLGIPAGTYGGPANLPPVQ
jgi:hypothetical protein